MCDYISRSELTAALRAMSDGWAKESPPDHVGPAQLASAVLSGLAHALSAPAPAASEVPVGAPFDCPTYYRPDHRIDTCGFCRGREREWNGNEWVPPPAASEPQPGEAEVAKAAYARQDIPALLAHIAAVEAERDAAVVTLERSLRTTIDGVVVKEGDPVFFWSWPNRTAEWRAGAWPGEYAYGGSAFRMPIRWGCSTAEAAEAEAAGCVRGCPCRH